MARSFRAMTVDDGRPSVGPSARTLGVRVPADIAEDTNHMVHAKTGGMSVAPAWRELPTHRIPQRLKSPEVPDPRGSNLDACWRMGEGPFFDSPLVGRLRLTVDMPGHGAIEPEATMPLSDYVHELSNTQSLWVIDET